MSKLIQNELFKILKKKEIYIILLILLLFILMFNLFKKITIVHGDILSTYKMAYNQDSYYLEHYDELHLKDKYTDILERTYLEKYAIDKNLKYNVLLNSENTNFLVPVDARVLLMRFFNNFDIFLIFVFIYLSSTIISKEYVSGTIKSLLIKPHKRIHILLSKLLTILFLNLFILLALLSFQYIIGGLFFGFDTYQYNAIRYNLLNQDIFEVDLLPYILLIVFMKLPMYIGLCLISMFFSIVRNNVALDIIITLSLYIISTSNTVQTIFKSFNFLFCWDLSNYIFENNIFQIYIALFVIILFIFILKGLLISVFINKDI